MSLQEYLAYTFSAPLGATKLYINMFFNLLGKYMYIVLWPPTMSIMIFNGVLSLKGGEIAVWGRARVN